MRITQEADYALRICAMLARCEQPVATPRISAELFIPPRFASKILRELMLAGLVKSTRGINGGFSLAKNASTISLRQIIESIDGKIAIRHCLMDDHNCNFQKDKSKCRFHCVFEELNNMIVSRLELLTLSDMVDAEIPVSELMDRLYRF